MLGTSMSVFNVLVIVLAEGRLVLLGQPKGGPVPILPAAPKRGHGTMLNDQKSTMPCLSNK